MESGLISSLFSEILILQREVQSALAQAFRDATTSGDLAQAAVVMLLAAVFGLVHAIGPGHGKSVMVSYFVGREAKVRQGLLASVKLIATHVGSAILLVLAAVTVIKVSFGLRPADFPLVRQISYAGVAGVGLYLLIQALRPARAQGQARERPNSGGLLPYIVGLSPCPLTTIIMLAASSTGAIAFGVLVSAAMALGMVVTVTAFAATAILARRWLLAALDRHLTRIARISQGFEILGAAAVTAIGAFLLATEIA